VEGWWEGGKWVSLSKKMEKSNYERTNGVEKKKKKKEKERNGSWWGWGTAQ